MPLRRIFSALKICVLAAFTAISLVGPGLSPASATAGLTLKAISAGYAHTCALTTTGAVWCWARKSVEEVPGLGSGMSAVAAGAYHTCALTAEGGVQCWGSNRDGQLGAETTELCGPSSNQSPCSSIPVDVTGLESGVAAVAGGGYHTCALTNAGGVKCWGSNEYGQLGDGTIDDTNTPVDVLNENGDPITGMIAVTAGDGHTCALTTAGGVVCWGENEDGQLGNGAHDDDLHPIPANVTGLDSGVSIIAAGANSTHTCALTAAGSVTCWGSNGSGQLGNGTSGNSSDVPVDVLDLGKNVTAITAGGGFGGGLGHTCALMATGGVKCWGSNQWSQLGNGTRFTVGSSTPEDVCQEYDRFQEECSEVLSGVGAIAAGGFHTCALPTAVGAKCWGTCVLGQLGTVPCPDTGTPIDVAIDSDGDGMPDSYEFDHPCLDMKSDDAADDPDEDGLASRAEFFSTDPCLPDTDGDGCIDGRERGEDASLGGERDPTNFWDFFDPNRDRSVGLLDFLAVLRHFGTAGDPSTLDPDAPEPPPGDYWALADRGGQAPGGDPWDELPANGSIGLSDFLSVLRQFGHSCA